MIEFLGYGEAYTVACADPTARAILAMVVEMEWIEAEMGTWTEVRLVARMGQLSPEWKRPTCLEASRRPRMGKEGVEAVRGPPNHRGRGSRLNGRVCGGRDRGIGRRE